MAAKEEEVVLIINDLQNHMNSLERVGTSRRVEDVIIDAMKDRHELDKITANVLEGFTSAIRAYCNSVHTISTVTDHRLDILDPDQLNILEQSYGTVISQFDKLRQVCVDASKLYNNSSLLSRSYGTLANFAISLFTNLGINQIDFTKELENLKIFNENFKKLEAIFRKAETEISNTRSDSNLSVMIKSFLDIFNDLHKSFIAIGGSVPQIKKLFIKINEDELVEGYDYLLMIKELFTIFAKILADRVQNGYADVGLFKELDSAVEDKPDNLVQLATSFRASFS